MFRLFPAKKLCWAYDAIFGNICKRNIKVWHTGGSMHPGLAHEKAESEQKSSVNIWMFPLNAISFFCTTYMGWGISSFFV